MTHDSKKIYFCLSMFLAFFFLPAQIFCNENSTTPIYYIDLQHWYQLKVLEPQELADNNASVDSDNFYELNSGSGVVKQTPIGSDLLEILYISGINDSKEQTTELTVQLEEPHRLRGMAVVEGACIRAPEPIVLSAPLPKEEKIYPSEKFEFQSSIPRQCSIEYLDCAEPEFVYCSNIIGAMVSFEFLYWRASEGGLNVCDPILNVDSIDSDGVEDFVFSATKNSPNFKWSPGFRLEWCYEFQTNCWDISLAWTHLHSEASLHGISDRGFLWLFHFDNADFVLGREFNVGSCLSLRPFGGIRYSRIFQYARLVGTIDDFSFSENNNEFFWGAGPLIGLDAKWNLGCGFNIYSRAAIANLYGDFHVQFNETSTIPSERDFTNLDQRLNAIQLVTDVALGVGWETCFYNGIVLELKIGLENHRYYNHNQLGSCGDLSLDGINFSARFKF